MSEIVLDLGSGHNAPHMKEMVRQVASLDTKKHDIIFKTQLFTDIPPNKPLSYDEFEEIYYYADSKDYKLTSSVFDQDSLAFLLDFDIPFVKIACRPSLYEMVNDVRRSIMTYVSTAGQWVLGADIHLLCVPEYPAKIQDYEKKIGKTIWAGVSDHTVGLDLFDRFKPAIWERHIKLPKMEGPDAGEWASTPQQLREGGVL